jgi:hypothetical protein
MFPRLTLWEATTRCERSAIDHERVLPKSRDQEKPRFIFRPPYSKRASLIRNKFPELGVKPLREIQEAPLGFLLSIGIRGN